MSCGGAKAKGGPCVRVLATDMDLAQSFDKSDLLDWFSVGAMLQTEAYWQFTHAVGRAWAGGVPRQVARGAMMHRSAVRGGGPIAINVASGNPEGVVLTARCAKCLAAAIATT